MPKRIGIIDFTKHEYTTHDVTRMKQCTNAGNILPQVLSEYEYITGVKIRYNYF